MNNTVKKLFHIITRNKFEFRNKSYSQEGEDLFLQKYFGTKSIGYYIDIGAHHPKRFSNTYLFYCSGWRGLNIDAMPGSMSLFKTQRPGDINLEVGLGLHDKETDFYVFNETAINTFSEKEASTKVKSGKYFVKEIRKIQVRRLVDILSDNWPYSSIDFMSVDVEGYDLNVLASNDWSLYRPKILLVEDLLRGDLLNLNSNELVKFMLDKRYVPIGRTYSTLFFEDLQK